MNSTQEERKRSWEDFRQERLQERMAPVDYLAAFITVAVGLGILLVAVSAYWTTHGAAVASFAFWTVGDSKWLEALFWAFLTSVAWNTNQAASALADKTFQTRDSVGFISRIVEQPLIAIALVFVLTNLGVSFGDTTLSLTDAPAVVVVGLTIVAVFFTDQTLETLSAVATWAKAKVQASFATPEDQPQPQESEPQQEPSEAPV